MEKATFAAGCFWGVEQKFKSLEGVNETSVGYMGGDTVDPTYKQVCTGETNHAEVVQLVYDPSVVTYESLLIYFFNLHDPTTLNKQGPDIGTQYRSAIFFHSESQEQQAGSVISSLQAKFDQPIVTEVTRASEFYRAEEYHQCYLEKNGLGSCS